jgi:hypothetical protein
MKLVLLDNDSPFHFVLAGSTQATFWWSINIARPNGLNMLTGSHVLSTRYDATPVEISLCRTVVTESKMIDEADFKSILGKLSYQTLANIMQVVKNRRGRRSVDEAHGLFLEAKANVYWRDYTAVPEGTDTGLFVKWVDGDTQVPPRHLQHLFELRNGLYFLRDTFFETFLKTYYNPHVKRLVYYGEPVPWADVVLFARLLPLAQIQNSQQQHGYMYKGPKIDESKFEHEAWNLHNAVFDQAQWPQLAQYVTQHPANPSYAKMNSQQISWVVLMRMLRNILAHERDLKWTGLSQCVQQVLRYTRTAQNFRLLIHAYETCVTP